ncbi:acetyltransferase, ribosomal protein N-acetylase [Tritrichomonas foetus]|uniref:Acetyltransferase, ribosomal protein N-acetylase n=1 Tax=Tritrichomonas foetus TaxID=1144522 RepID=A0A1J4JZR0_9EUKA|nr:acetyltransferase, ribosomal protein N-acetylase [Tritrichomonas foetus]|eukprot:OHT02741.1 acetyltransferase, ribosomal protein N-acetylase [Tritrichomonas foetus]
MNNSLQSEIIIDENIKLTKWCLDDAEELSVIANNRKISDNLRDGFPHPYCLQDAINFINISNDDNNSMNFCIKVNNCVAGGFGIVFHTDIYRRNCEIGYWLGEKYWGQGIMTRVVKSGVKYIFSNFDIVRIYADIFARNVGSKRVLEKAGFEFEGVLRKSVFKNGEQIDALSYSLIQE